MIKLLYKHDKCKNCVYFDKTDNSCEVKSVSDGTDRYVNIFDRLFCSFMFKKLKEEDEE